MAVVDKPQEGAIRLTPRISAIKTRAGDLKVRELIPIGSVIALSKEVWIKDAKHVFESLAAANEKKYQ